MICAEEIGLQARCLAKTASPRLQGEDGVTGDGGDRSDSVPVTLSVTEVIGESGLVCKNNRFDRSAPPPRATEFFTKSCQTPEDVLLRF